MELWEYLITIVSVGIFILIGLRMFLSRKPDENLDKSVKKDNLVSVKDANAIQIKALSDTINRLKADNKSLSSSNSRYKKLNTEDYEPASDASVPMEVLKQAAVSLNMDPKALDNNPELVEWIQEQARDPEVKKLILSQIKNKQSATDYSELSGV